MNTLLKPTTVTSATERPAGSLVLTVLLTTRRTLVALVAVGMGLMVAGYGYTVHAQQAWSQDYAELKRLTQTTRDLETATGNLDAQPMTVGSLVAPRPDQIFVLAPAPLRSKVVSSQEHAAFPMPTTDAQRLPLAY